MTTLHDFEMMGQAYADGLVKFQKLARWVEATIKAASIPSLDEFQGDGIHSVSASRVNATWPG